jgi:chemotaxis protein CheD
MRITKVGPGEHYVTDAPGEAISTTLGSCVAACIRDPVARVGGLNHFMLPRSTDGIWGKAMASLRYGNFAMERLINDILVRGGQRTRLEVKVFGGGQLTLDQAGIGESNAAYVEDYLAAEGMVPLAAELRGTVARKLLYLPVEGRVFMQELSTATGRIAAAETHFGQSLPHRLPVGEAELFD